MSQHAFPELASSLRRPARLAALLLLVPLASGCAAMFTGTKDEVRFTSDPPGALVRAGDQEGVTPVLMKLPKRTKTVQVSHASFGEREVELDRDFQGGFILMDLLFTPGFGASGLLIDAATAGFYELPPLVNIDFDDPSAEVGIARPEEEQTGDAGDA